MIRAVTALKLVTQSERRSWLDLRKPPNFITSCFDFPHSFIFVFFKMESVCCFFQLKSLVCMNVCLSVCVLGEGWERAPLGRGRFVWGRAVRNSVSLGISALGDALKSLSLQKQEVIGLPLSWAVCVLLQTSGWGEVKGSLGLGKEDSEESVCACVGRRLPGTSGRVPGPAVSWLLTPFVKPRGGTQSQEQCPGQLSAFWPKGLGVCCARSHLRRSPIRPCCIFQGLLLSV